MSALGFGLFWASVVAVGVWLDGWLTDAERRHQEQAHDDILLALAEAVGVVPEPDPGKVAATREALRLDALWQAQEAEFEADVRRVT